MIRSFTCWTALAAIAAASLSLCARASADTVKKHILVVTHTTGFRHGDSIPIAEGIIKDLGDKSGLFDVDYARNGDDVKQKMTADALKGYDAVFFCQTTGDLGLPDRQAFLDWIKAGHGFIGTHSATDTYHNWPEYIDLIGAEFQGHGPQVEVEVNVEDPNFPATTALPVDMQKSFKVRDEIYEFKPTSVSREKSHLLLSMSKHPQTGKPGDYWTSWSRSYGNGRVFYTALGHRPEVWKMDWYQHYLLGGIEWALGIVQGSSTPSGPLAATAGNPVALTVEPVATVVTKTGADGNTASASPVVGRANPTTGTRSNNLEGAWRLVSAKYGGVDAATVTPANEQTMYYITEARYNWMTYDLDTKIVTRAAGGSYSVRGDAYKATIQYGLGEGVQPLIGKELTFTSQVKGGRLYQSGSLPDGMKIEQVWERAE